MSKASLLVSLLLSGCLYTAHAAGNPIADERQSRKLQVPQFRVQPFWPKPLPQIRGADGQLRRWVSGEVGGICVDSHDHIITVNRGWQNGPDGGLHFAEAMAGTPAPPVVIFDVEGNVVGSWGDASLVSSQGASKVMPDSLHDCFVDEENNIWIAGSNDGIVQKYTHDGRLLLQIGTKGVCDGPPTLSPQAFFPTCGSPGYNRSTTLLNSPSDIWVDPAPDPVARQPGSVYIADGYGNHRVVVFDSAGRYLRQWGTAGDGPDQFAVTGGGHPHCIATAHDGAVYVCDRGHNRILVFDKMGVLHGSIPVNPVGGLAAPARANDIRFSDDPQQSFLYVADGGNAVVEILSRATGAIVGVIGSGPGHQAGQFVAPHQLAVDSEGNVYVAEVAGGRRVQKFVKQ